MPHHSQAECPDWYRLGRAARFWGVSPWELAEQPQAWVTWALIAESAEADAQEYFANQASK